MRDDAPDQAPGTEVPGAGAANDPAAALADEPARPTPDLSDINRVITSDDDGDDQGAPPPR
jgi:hypothetical protein